MDHWKISYMDNNKYIKLYMNNKINWDINIESNRYIVNHQP